MPSVRRSRNPKHLTRLYALPYSELCLRTARAAKHRSAFRTFWRALIAQTSLLRAAESTRKRQYPLYVWRHDISRETFYEGTRVDPVVIGDRCRMCEELQQQHEGRRGYPTCR